MDTPTTHSVVLKHHRSDTDLWSDTDGGFTRDEVPERLQGSGPQLSGSPEDIASPPLHRPTSRRWRASERASGSGVGCQRTGDRTVLIGDPFDLNSINVTLMCKILRPDTQDSVHET